MYGQQSSAAGATRLTFGRPAWPQTGGDVELVDQLKALIASSGQAGMLLVDLRRVMQRRLVAGARLDRALGVLRTDPTLVETRERRTSAGRPSEEQIVFRLGPVR